MPLDRFCNLVWYWSTKDMREQKDIEALRQRIWQPPKGVEATKGPWSREEEMASFAAVMRATGAGKGEYQPPGHTGTEPRIAGR